MAEIVGGFCMPHDPLITGNPEAADPTQAKVVMEAFASVAKRLDDLEVDTLIVIGDDHYVLFGPGCIPPMLIAIGDIEGPLEPWLRIERRQLRNHEGLARHILQDGYAKKFDWAASKTMTLDHSTMVPIHLAIPKDSDVRVVPIYLSAGVDPLIPMRRAFEVGCQIREAVRSWEGNERVAVFGTGGLSHWVGMKDMGRVNEEFDRRVLGWVETGDVEAILALDDAYLLENAGNGSLEIRNWVCAMGVVGGLERHVNGTVIAYEPIPPWVTGLGFAELRAA